MRKEKNHKKFLVTAVTATLVASALVPTASASFSDATGHYSKAVDYVTEKGIAKGIGNSIFGVNETLTRGDAAVMIANALQLNVNNAPVSLFTDVNSRVKNAVNALYASGIIHGKTKTTFAPDDKITRAEIAKILVNAYQLDGKDGKNTFKDVNVNWVPYTNALVKHKITQGKTATSFNPTQLVTRGEFALFAYRLKDTKIPIVPQPGENNFELSLMHTNDIHANTAKAPKLVTAVNEVRAAKPDALLLNAGDVFSGTLYFNEFQGMADLAFMNLMKVDAMTFGNHEFDLGSSAEGHKALADFIKAANFPFVSANVDFAKDPLFDGLFNTKISSTPENSNIYAGIVKVINGEKVGIFGLTTAETKDIASPGAITFSDYIEDAEKMVAEFEKMGVNKIVALTHIGFDDNAAMDNDQELAANVAGIDVIVGGHSHTQLDVPVVVDKDENGKAKDKTIIVQAYQYSDYLGTLDVEFDKNGVVIGHAGKLIKTADKAEDAEAVKLLKPYMDKITAVNEEEIGVTLENALVSPRTSDEGYVAGTSVRASETILGNLITDGMLAKAQGYVKDKKVIMAFQNGGGIRAGIGAGPITVGEVITVLPFGNTLATMELTGAEIKQTFEVSVKGFPAESGGFLHVSGAKVKFDSTKPAGERVISIEYKNEDGTYTAIENATTYTVATNAFTAKGGDGYDVLKKAYGEGRVTDLGLSDWENLREHLKSLGTIPAKIEGRIVDVAGVVVEPETEHPGTENPSSEVAGNDFSGTIGTTKVYNGNVTVSVTGVVSLGNVTVKGDLILTGTPTENVSFANITVEGDLDLSDLDSDAYKFEGITVVGETIL